MSDDPLGLPIDQGDLDLIREEVVEERDGNAFLSELDAKAQEAPRTDALYRGSETSLCTLCLRTQPRRALRYHPGIGNICSDDPDCTGAGVSDWKDVALKAIREWGWLAGQTDSPVFADDDVESWARLTIRNRIAPQASDAEMQEMAEAYMVAYKTVKEGLI